MKLPLNLQGWFPNSLKTLKIYVYEDSPKNPSFNFSSFLKVGTLPNSIEQLEIEHRLFKHNLDIIPDSVTDLTILNWDPKDINSDQFIIKPRGSVRKLAIKLDNLDFIRKKDECFTLGRIPDTVSELFLPSQFNISNGRLQSLNIKKLSFGVNNISFNQEDIPKSVEDLNIYYEGNFKLVGSIPFGVKNLTLYSQVQIDPFTLPNSIKKLRLDTHNPIVPNQIPPSTEYLTFTGNGQIIEPGSIPNGVKEIDFSGCDIPITKCTFPLSVKSIKLRTFDITLIQDGILPHSLTKLIVISDKYQPLPPNISTILPSLEYLECTFENINYPLPNSLKTLIFKLKVKHIDVGMIPPSVKTIIFGEVIEFPVIEGLLPPFLNHLELYFGHALIPFPILPHSLEHLKINVLYGKGIEIPIGGLPESLNHLVLYHYKYPIRKCVLPSKIRKLELHHCYHIKDIYIPNSVPELILNPSKSDENFLSKLMENIVLNSTSKYLKLKIFPFTILSFDNDPYIYFHYSKHGDSFDGFLLKTNISSRLNQYNFSY
eukprot:gene955-1212_t